MTRDDALKQARKRWGDKAYIEAKQRVSSPERRQGALNDATRLRARLDEIKEIVDARLAALDWYQVLKAESETTYKKLQEARSSSAYYKFSVGDVSRTFVQIRGTGDTWEEAFNSADKAEGRAARGEMKRAAVKPDTDTPF